MKDSVVDRLRVYLLFSSLLSRSSCRMGVSTSSSRRNGLSLSHRDDPSPLILLGLVIITFLIIIFLIIIIVKLLFFSLLLLKSINRT